VVFNIYRRQVENSIKRGNVPPSYTKEELLVWMTDQPVFHTIYDEWVISGHNVKKAVSVDRKSDYDNYSFSTIKIMTWEENHAKGIKDTLSGSNTKRSKSVDQFDMDMKFIKTFKSIAIASRESGAGASEIVLVCNGKRNYAMNFKWRYS